MLMRTLAVMGVVLAVGSPAWAENIRGIDIGFVAIGNAGNAADTGGTVGCGAVGYEFRMGQYEITNAQWNAFVTAAGVPTGSDSGAYGTLAYWDGAAQPTNNVSWYEAAQFCNYLTSGYRTRGAYRFSGDDANPGYFEGINRTVAQTVYGTIYVIPTEDEWYKAAYFKPDGSGYSIYANWTGTPPSTSDTCWNQYNPYPGPWSIGLGTMELNGTFNMMGNIYEWNETLSSGSYRGLRGGWYGSNSVTYFKSNYWNDSNPKNQFSHIGFRVASVPEPCGLTLLLAGGVVLRRLRK